MRHHKDNKPIEFIKPDGSFELQWICMFGYNWREYPTDAGSKSGCYGLIDQEHEDSTIRSICYHRIR